MRECSAGRCVESPVVEAVVASHGLNLQLSEASDVQPARPVLLPLLDLGGVRVRALEPPTGDHDLARALRRRRGGRGAQARLREASLLALALRELLPFLARRWRRRGCLRR
jgi:hypothetical protein